MKRIILCWVFLIPLMAYGQQTETPQTEVVLVYNDNEPDPVISFAEIESINFFTTQLNGHLNDVGVPYALKMWQFSIISSDVGYGLIFSLEDPDGELERRYGAYVVHKQFKDLRTADSLALQYACQLKFEILYEESPVKMGIEEILEYVKACECFHRKL